MTPKSTPQHHQDLKSSGIAAEVGTGFTSYLRDGVGSDDAQHRRYNRYYARFEQPDPYDGSYDLTYPQSLNRYPYVQNDPVNFIDPEGLNLCSAEYSYVQCGGDDGLWGDGYGISGGGFGDDVAMFSDLQGMPGNVRAALLGYEQRVNDAFYDGFHADGESFDIHYGYDAGGDLWTYFELGVGITHSQSSWERLGSRLRNGLAAANDALYMGMYGRAHNLAADLTGLEALRVDTQSAESKSTLTCGRVYKWQLAKVWPDLARRCSTTLRR